ncbi:MAG: P27 family phage terminase small subunit [Acetobacteraceae bacterium]|nr:P27 family phage terminase small subunit [Acetobacteraceae bacterium]
MPRRGPRPKPTALHVLEGTYRTTRHRDRADEPQPPPGPLDAPDWLSDGQRAGWDYALEHAPRDLLRPIDRGVLVVWIEAEDRHRRAVIAQAQLDARHPVLPMLTAGARGTLVGSPYLRIIARAAETMLRAASELGFSPASRPRLAATPDAAAPAEDGWSRMRLLQGGQADPAA